MAKRSDYIDWDSMFIGVAAIAAMRSKDPHTVNGACIVNPETHRIYSVGYNGMPAGCSDDEFPWSKTSDSILEVKYTFVIHAERNALDNFNGDMTGATLYLFSQSGYYPCPSCAQGIIQKGLKNVVMAYVDTANHGKKFGMEGTKATRKMFEAAKIGVRVIEPLARVTMFTKLARQLDVFGDIMKLADVTNISNKDTQYG